MSSLVVLGLACLLNALRCGRLHCYLTGPFYLAWSLAVATYGLGHLPLGERRWRWLGLGVVVVGNLLQCPPERRWERYRHTASDVEYRGVAFVFLVTGFHHSDVHT